MTRTNEELDALIAEALDADDESDDAEEHCTIISAGATVIMMCEI